VITLHSLPRSFVDYAYFLFICSSHKRIKDRITTSIDRLLCKILNQMKYCIVFMVTHSKIFNTDLLFPFHKAKSKTQQVLLPISLYNFDYTCSIISKILVTSLVKTNIEKNAITLSLFDS
jgi:hypothetical protein